MPNYRIIEYVGDDAWTEKCLTNELNYVRGEVVFANSGRRLIERIVRDASIVEMSSERIEALKGAHQIMKSKRSEFVSRGDDDTVAIITADIDLIEAIICDALPRSEVSHPFNGDEVDNGVGIQYSPCLDCGCDRSDAVHS
jgi:hypothetical protein